MPAARPPSLMSGQLIIRMMAGLSELGVDADRVLSRVGLDRETVAGLNEHLPLSLLYDLWDAVVTETGQRGYGIRLAQRIRPENYDVFGSMLTSSANLADAAIRAGRFIRLVANDVVFSLHVEGDRALFIHKTPGNRTRHPESTEFLIAATGVIARQITARHLVPLEVHFSHDAPPDVAPYEDLFGGPVRFRKPHSALVFPSEYLHLSVVSSDARICELVERSARELLALLPESEGLARRVQELLIVELNGGNPSIENISRKLELHPRTLSRRLRREGTSHQELLDKVRYDIADRYLSESDMSISEVAYRLGYSDTSAFDKAFKRWTGSAPHAYRQRAAQ